MAKVEIYSKQGNRLGLIDDEAEQVEYTEEWLRIKKKRRNPRKKKKETPDVPEE